MRAPLHALRAVLHVERRAAGGVRDCVHQRKLRGGRCRRAAETFADFLARLGRQRVEDRLGGAVHQRIAVAHRDGKSHPHADVARRPRHLGGFGRQVGQPLRAGVVHHHDAGTAERAARERHRGAPDRDRPTAPAPCSAARSPAACRTRRSSSSARSGRDRARCTATGSASTGSTPAPVAAGPTAAMCSPSIRMRLRRRNGGVGGREHVSASQLPHLADTLRDRQGCGQLVALTQHALVLRRQERAAEHVRHRGLARQLERGGDDVDGVGHAGILDVADAQFGRFRRRDQRPRHVKQALLLDRRG